MNRLAMLIIVSCCWLFLSVPLVAEAQSGADKRLLQKTTIKAEAKPVEEVLRELCEKHKLVVEFDPSVKENAAGETPFTLTAEGLTLGSVIDLACRSASLTHHMEKGKLLISTPEAEDANPVVRQYALAALGAIPDMPTFLEGLQRVTSGLWKDIDGDGGEFVAVTPQSLSIRQTRRVHEELQSLFENLAAAATGRARPVTVQERAEQMIVRKLQSITQLPGGNMPASDVLDQLLKKSGIPYWIDLIALKEESIDWDKATSTVDAKKMPMATRLDSILEELKLVWRVDDEVVQITTRVKADEQLTTRVYDVRRLITPNRLPQTLADELTSNKDFGPWEETDGEGGNVMVLNTLLVVRQKDAIHAKLAKLLK